MIQALTLPDTLIPEEYHVVKNKGVMGLEYHEESVTQQQLSLQVALRPRSTISIDHFESFSCVIDCRSLINKQKQTINQLKQICFKSSNILGPLHKMSVLAGLLLEQLSEGCLIFSCTVGKYNSECVCCIAVNLGPSLVTTSLIWLCSHPCKYYILNSTHHICLAYTYVQRQMLPIFII